jgi:hypothetical protein
MRGMGVLLRRSRRQRMRARVTGLPTGDNRMETYYKVVYQARLAPGFTRAQAIAGLVAGFGLTEAKAAALVDSTGPRVVKSDVDRGTAERIAGRLQRAGLVAAVTGPPAVTAIDPEPPVAESQAPRPMSAAFQNPSTHLEMQPKPADPCPSCGARQVEQGVCRACRTVAAKFLARQAAGGPPAAWSSTAAATTPAAGGPIPARPEAGVSPAGRPLGNPPVDSGGVLGGIGRIVRMLKLGILALLLVFAGVVVLFDPGAGDGGGSTATGTTGPTGHDARPRYVRPQTAPNGTSWPRTAGYVPGYQQLNTNGYSSVTIDNSRNDSDVFVKLFSLSGARARPARVFYIPAYRAFTVSGVAGGRYDVRYRDLDSGGLARSEPFDLVERHTAQGVHYQEYTLTLYKVRDGNTRTYPLAESEF